MKILSFQIGPPRVARLPCDSVDTTSAGGGPGASTRPGLCREHHENLPPVREAFTVDVYPGLPAVQMLAGAVDPVEGALAPGFDRQ